VQCHFKLTWKHPSEDWKDARRFQTDGRQKGFTEKRKIRDGVKTGKIVNWLKADSDLGHGHAMAIVCLFQGKKTEST
jgi:Domain of unknown function (DUF4287)